MLQLNNIVKDYNVSKDLTVHALKGVSINFRANEFVSILGPSGCGKTTLLNIIGGLDHYTQGDMLIDGISTKNYGEKQWNSYRNLRIGFVFQSYNLIQHQSVIENVELALTLSGVSKEERKQRAKQALIDVGLEKEVNKRPNQLSGGQMQRVALARALVNNPQIVLADEPTGALDSVTGVQVMELLKKVAQNHLVIMVTHNAELAEQYSTRIIKLKDGEVLSDSNPYTDKQLQQDTEKEKAKQQQQIEQQQQTEQSTQQVDDKKRKKDKKPKDKKHKVKMSWWTALSLSFKNLLSKKGRTMMTSFAGSIGIIGVALVLAISNGFNIYIADLQTNTLSGYPVQISPISADITALQEQMMSGTSNDLPKFPEGDNNLHVYDETAILGDSVKYNMITQSYVDYIEEFYKADQQKPKELQQINTISYSYQKSLNIFVKSGDQYKQVETDTSTSGAAGSIMQSFMGSSSVFQEAIPNKDYLLTQYDVLDGEYPKNYNEVAIIVDSRNRISTATLDALGIEYTTQGDNKFADITFEELLGKQFLLVYNNDYYVPSTTSSGIVYSELSKLPDWQTTLQQLVDDKKVETLTITAVLRVNENAPLSLYDTGILYLPSLTEKFIEDSINSDIAKAMTTTEGKVYFKEQSENNSFYTLTDISTVQRALKNPITGLGVMLTEEEVIDYCKHQVGASLTPSGISIYPTDFNAKDDILKYLDAWNDTEQGKNNPIYYTDATAVLSSTLGQLVNIISYVLVAFASISLVVSSVMIGIITYVSVIERTKEIGVLRSLGASKRDVSNIFNAESFLIGLTAGLFGVLVTYILSIPINIIILAVAQGALNTNIAVLNPLAALILVVISCALTLISSSIPARMASKLDPVKALRTE